MADQIQPRATSLPHQRAAVPLTPHQAKSLPEVLTELKDLTIAYAKLETVEPIKALGRFIALGAAGAVLMGLGTILLSLAGLRALQMETGTALTGSWNWVPYAVAFVILALFSYISLKFISRRPKKERR
jgi:hypothetical protein